MADSKTWIDVAAAAIDVAAKAFPILGTLVGTLGGAALGAWGQAHLAEKNNTHARQQAQDALLEQQRQQVRAEATAFVLQGGRVLSTARQALGHVVERFEKEEQGHPFSVLEMPEDMDKHTQAAQVPVAALRVLAQDDALLAPLLTWEGAVSAVPAAAGDLRDAFRVHDGAAFTAAEEAIETLLKTAEQALRQFEASARKALGVSLAPRAALPAADDPAALPPGK